MLDLEFFIVGPLLSPKKKKKIVPLWRLLGRSKLWILADYIIASRMAYKYDITNATSTNIRHVMFTSSILKRYSDNFYF